MKNICHCMHNVKNGKATRGNHMASICFVLPPRRRLVRHESKVSNFSEGRTPDLGIVDGTAGTPIAHVQRTFWSEQLANSKLR